MNFGYGFWEDIVHTSKVHFQFVYQHKTLRRIPFMNVVNLNVTFPIHSRLFFIDLIGSLI